MKKIILIALAVTFSFQLYSQRINRIPYEGVSPQDSYEPTFKSDGAKKAPLNIILMIGDGAGLSHLASGYYANGGELTLTNLKHAGWVTTQSLSDFITDSAASGTAYSTGNKTLNSRLGVDKDGKPMENIPEAIADEGIVSGVVSTDDLNGATPASFFAHQVSRNSTNEIWADVVDSELTYFAAGSKEAFAARPAETQNAINETFTIVNSLDDPRIETADRLGYLPSAKEVDLVSKGRTDFLPAATRNAIEFLSSKTERKKGFFLMVESARIDKASHGHDYVSTVQEVLDFDKAIEEAIKFADEDGNTLVIISADHETGGLVLWQSDPEKGNVTGVYTSGNHTGTPVPIFAYGPRAQDFMGVQGNEEVAQKILKLFLNK